VAIGGGALPANMRAPLLEAARAGLTLVSGLHEFLGDDPEILAAARAGGSRIIDVRRPRPRAELHFWTGAIARVRAPRLAVLGTDCALGKRTTARLIVQACRAHGVRAEMIYTGQTGWMQGGRYGFILDAVLNDFVSGELEHAIVSCDSALSPELIVIEGQSALRNPSGPCGSELVVSGQARAVVLQHAPGRRDFKGHAGWLIPPIEEEIDLVRLLGARVVALALNGQYLAPEAVVAEQRRLGERLGLPVIRPVEEGVDALVPLLRQYLAAQK
jgi:uncharacterized NAD-dependent epimerase/dehydratase family protein